MGDALFVGCPTTVGLALPQLDITAPAAEGAWRWQADGVRVSLHAGAPMDPVIDLAGAHKITGLLAAPGEGLSLNVERGMTSLVFARDGTLENIVLKLSETTIAGTADHARMLGLNDGSLHIATKTGHVTLQVHDITLPEAVPMLGKTVTSLDLTLDVVGPFPPGPLRGALEAWRTGGGAIEVRSVALNWPPARATGTGTIALDEALQPIGAATIKFQGFFDIVAALVEKGHVREREASMAKIVLGMLAKPSATGEPELSLPLTVQDRKLFAGPVMLMEMPEVVWDENARVP
jgi:hypothetical protein